MKQFSPFEEILAVSFEREPGPALHRTDYALWSKIVAAGGARIVSTLETPDSRAYVLSSSSLLLFPARLILITCGPADIIAAFASLIATLPEARPREVRYIVRRQVSAVPELLPSKVEQLAALLPGWNIKHRDTSDEAAVTFSAPQVLQLKAAPSNRVRGVRLFFNLPASSAPVVQDIVQSLKPRFLTDEHHFSPWGYSANALRGLDYATVHYSPEHGYLSFEVETASKVEVAQILNQVMQHLTAEDWAVRATP